MSAAVSKVPVATGDFTAKEVAHVRAALRSLRLRCGSWVTLAPVAPIQRDHLVETSRVARSR